MHLKRDELSGWREKWLYVFWLEFDIWMKLSIGVSLSLKSDILFEGISGHLILDPQE